LKHYNGVRYSAIHFVSTGYTDNFLDYFDAKILRTNFCVQEKPSVAIWGGNFVVTGFIHINGAFSHPGSYSK
jgi:hypothetical protein